MGYAHNVFISYRRHPTWTPWTAKCLRALLDAYLAQELYGSDTGIYMDKLIEPGADWPNRLGTALARARVLIPVFTGDYFSSDWCIHELDLMHGRMTRHPESCLIIPLIGHDGEFIPSEIGRLLPVDIKRFRTADINPRSILYQEFSKTVKAFSPRIADAIRAAPDFDPAWEEECRNRFNDLYAANCAGDRVSPMTITLKPVPKTILVPRPRP